MEEVGGGVIICDAEKLLSAVGIIWAILTYDQVIVRIAK